MDLTQIEDLSQLVSSYSTVLLIVSILIGLLWCFFGYRLFKVIVGILGFIMGALLGVVITAALSDSQLVIILGALIGGIVGAGLLVALYFLGVFLLGAVFGALLATVIFSSVNIGDPAATIILVVLALIGGIVAVALQRVIIILSTSFSGAWTAVTGVFALAGADYSALGMLQGPRAVQSAVGTYYIMLIVALILAITGIVIQFTVTGKKPAAAAVPPPPPVYPYPPGPAA